MKDWKVTGYEMDGDNTKRGEKREKRIKTKWGRYSAVCRL